MTVPSSYPALLARDIAHRIAQLTEHLPQASPEQAAQIMKTVMDSEEGILGRLSGLLATASHYTRDRAADSGVAQELWQDLGRSADHLHDLSLDLETQTEEFALLADTPTATATATATSLPTSPPPPPTPPAGLRGPR